MYITIIQTWCLSKKEKKKKQLVKEWALKLPAEVLRASEYSQIKGELEKL